MNHTHPAHKATNINDKQEHRLGLQDRIALAITGAVGTMYAVYFFVVVLLGWMIWQGVLSSQPFDPFPFAFLLFLGNIVQLLLMPLIMVGQNLQNEHAELRAEEEFTTTTTVYHDIESILAHLDEQDAMIRKLTALVESKK